MAKKKSKQKELFQVFKKFDTKHLKNILNNKKTIDELYDSIIANAARLGFSLKHDSKDEFFFKDYPGVNEKMDKLLEKFANSVRSKIIEGNREEWLLSAEKNAAMIDAIYKGSGIPKETLEEWKSPNLDALEAFQNRKLGDNGMDLSQRVWNLTQQTKAELELALDIGIGKGKSAAELSRDVRRFLREPNKLFRRVRDERGNLRLSKAAAAYHPGQGVYRSSYKNALRMTATENNMAYRSADNAKWSQLDFVLGYEIRLSNNHTLNGKPFKDMCDLLVGKYPKTFKFTGWHPFCRCFATPIVADWNEQLKVMKMQKEGKDVSNYHFAGEIKNVPSNYSEWIANNAERIANASSKPIFIRDNYIDGDIEQGFTWEAEQKKKQAVLDAAEARHKARTTQEEEDIRQRLKERQERMKADKLAAEQAIKAAKEFPQDINLDEISHWLSKGQTTKAGALAVDINKAVEANRQAMEEMRGTFADIDTLVKDYSISFLRQNYNAIHYNTDILKKLSLQDQEKQLTLLSDNAANELQKKVYDEKLSAVKIDIAINNIKPQVNAIVANAKNASIPMFRDMADKLTDAIARRDMAAVSTLLRDAKTMEVLVERYDELRAYKSNAKKLPQMLDDIEKLLNNGDMQNAIKKLQEAEAEQERLELRKAYLAQQREAKKNAKNNAPEEPAEPQKTIADCVGIDELTDLLGDKMPVILRKYKDAISRSQYTRDNYKKAAQEMEAKLKEMFDSSDFAHVNESYLFDERILDNGILTNLQTSTSETDYNRRRRSYGHFAYGLQDSRIDVVPKSQRLGDGEYYRCGTPVPKDKNKAWEFAKRARSYGDTQVIFRKDRVVTTWTYGNSLQTDCIPSLTSAPKVCSIDDHTFRNYKDKNYLDLDRVQEGIPYIEIQYLPLNGSKGIMPRDMERITFPAHPEKLHKKEIWDRWYQEGVDIYYYDGNEVKLYRKGKPLETPEETRARILKAAKERQAKRDADLKKQGKTREDEIQAKLAERQKLLIAAEEKATKFSQDIDSYTNKDTETLVATINKRIKEKNYAGANTAIEELKNEQAKYNAKAQSMADDIPDFEKWHKDFTLAEIESAYAAIKSKYAHFDRKCGDDKQKWVEKLEFEIGYIENPTNQKYSTWKIARDAYKSKLAAVNFEIKKEATIKAFNDIKGFKSRSTKFKALIEAAEDYITTGDFDAANAKIQEATTIKNSLEAARSKTSGVAPKHGEAQRITFMEDAFSQAEKDNALWFKNKTNPQLSFNECDQIMTKYAQDIWSRLTDEEKHVAYLYTSGSRYINEPFFTTYGAVKKSPVDGSIRSSEKDINTLTSIIEKCKPLEQAMWVQHAEDVRGFYSRFGKNLYSITDLSTLVGVEAVNAPFMSTSCAKYSLFTKEDKFPNLDVVMSIYLPKGTKGLYCEPFAHWGDGKIYGTESTRYGASAAKWDGKSRQDTGRAAGDQVEFLLQRGAKIRITKAEYKDGRWYIDCDLVEQTAVTPFKE